MSGKRVNIQILFLSGLWMIGAAAFAADVSAEPMGVERVNNLGELKYDRVVDVRSLPACETASMPRARCLPLNYFVHASGKHITLHALRWLLGTIGLDGSETVLVISSHPADAHTAGALMYQAGQRRVQVLETPYEAATDADHVGGEIRSMSRETVFTQPVRTGNGKT